MKSKGHDIVYTFKEKAISYSDEDRSVVYKYTVHLLQGNNKYDLSNGHSYNGLIISIEDTPGSWYVSTYLHYTENDRLDYGSINGDWLYYNKINIKKELVDWIENVYPYYQEIHKYNL